MISYAPCTSLARVTADEGGGENFSNASSHATKGVNVQFFTFICNNADDITRSTATTACPALPGAKTARSSQVAAIRYRSGRARISELCLPSRHASCSPWPAARPMQKIRTNVALWLCRVLLALEGTLGVTINGQSQDLTDFQIAAHGEEQEEGEAFLETPIDGYYSLF